MAWRMNVHASGHVRGSACKEEVKVDVGCIPCMGKGHASGAWAARGASWIACIRVGLKIKRPNGPC